MRVFEEYGYIYSRRLLQQNIYTTQHQRSESKFHSLRQLLKHSVDSWMLCSNIFAKLLFSCPYEVDLFGLN